MTSITQIYAYVVDEGDGDEGIPAVLLDGSWWPLLGADMKRCGRVGFSQLHSSTIKCEGNTYYPPVPPEQNSLWSRSATTLRFTLFRVRKWHNIINHHKIVRLTIF
jgi:hypothetical protein